VYCEGEEGISPSCTQLFCRLLGSLTLPNLMQDPEAMLCTAGE